MTKTTMLVQFLFLALGSAFWIGPTVITIACWTYFRYVRSRSAALLLVASAGTLVVSVLGAIGNVWFGQRVLELTAKQVAPPAALHSQQSQFVFVLNVLAIGLSLLFSFSLLVTLREAVKRLKLAESRDRNDEHG